MLVSGDLSSSSPNGHPCCGRKSHDADRKSQTHVCVFNPNVSASQTSFKGGAKFHDSFTNKREDLRLLRAVGLAPSTVNVLQMTPKC